MNDIIAIAIEASALFDAICKIGVLAAKVVIAAGAIPVVWRVSSGREP